MHKAFVYNCRKYIQSWECRYFRIHMKIPFTKFNTLWNMKNFILKLKEKSLYVEVHNYKNMPIAHHIYFNIGIFVC